MCRSNNDIYACHTIVFGMRIFLCGHFVYGVLLGLHVCLSLAVLA